MTGKQYELRVAQRLANAGFQRVQLTRSSADYGADIVCYDGLGLMVVQCKHYRRPVGVKAIQEAIAARQFYGASRAAVATNNRFTRNAKIMAKRCRVELMEGLK